MKHLEKDVSLSLLETRDFIEFLSNEKFNSRKGSGTDLEETKETERGHKTAMHLEN